MTLLESKQLMLLCFLIIMHYGQVLKGYRPSLGTVLVI